MFKVHRTIVVCVGAAIKPVVASKLKRKDSADSYAAVASLSGEEEMKTDTTRTRLSKNTKEDNTVASASVAVVAAVVAAKPVTDKESTMKRPASAVRGKGRKGLHLLKVLA